MLKRGVLLVIAGCILLGSGLVQAAGGHARIITHKVFLDNGQLRLQARAQIRLSAEMLSALEHSIPLTFVWEIEIEKKRPWYVWDKELYDRKLTRKLFLNRSLGMHAISNPDSGKTVYYRKLAEALEALARIDVINLLGQDELDAGSLYTSSLDFKFKASSLPAAMYLKGLFAPGWQLKSNKHIKRFNP